MNKTSKLSALRSVLAGALMFGATSALAQSTAPDVTIQLDSTANIVEQITVDAVDPLHFGDILRGTAGEVTVAATGGRSSATPAILGNEDGAGPASFNIRGDAGATYSIQLPEVAEMANLTSGGSEKMTLVDFTHDAGPTPTIAEGAGGSVVRVGATLQVAQDQVKGHYAGTFDVTVSYN